MNKLIINSDDFGYSRGINHAIIDTHLEGILTSTSLMTNTPGFQHAVDLAKAHPTLGIGVHLVLTFLKPLRDDVPSLTDQHGTFYHADIYRKHKHAVDPKELYKEWDTQIQKVIASGITPTHLDSHHHVHTHNAIHQAVFLKLAKKYALATRKIPNLKGTAQLPKTTTYFEPAFDEVTSLSIKEQEAYLNTLYNKIKEHGSTEVMCHVGYLDEFLLSSSSFTELRAYQVNSLSHSSFADKIRADQDIQLIHFGNL